MCWRKSTIETKLNQTNKPRQSRSSLLQCRALLSVIKSVQETAAAATRQRASSEQRQEMILSFPCALFTPRRHVKEVNRNGQYYRGRTKRGVSRERADWGLSYLC
eukprot:scaffold5451_cov102-Alexandrium_tamarense.AAC.1